MFVCVCSILALLHCAAQGKVQVSEPIVEVAIIVIEIGQDVLSPFPI